MSQLSEEELLSPTQTQRIIEQLAENLFRDFTQPRKRVVVGIHRGGAILARRIRDLLTGHLGFELPLGFLDITFYRDDLETVGPNPVLGATELDMDIDDKRIVLVDDVLFTGRTIRAAMEALFDYGRPEIVDLVVLVDRGHRQLPISPDYAGMVVETGQDESVKLVEDPHTNELHVIRRFQAEVAKGAK